MAALSEWLQIMLAEIARKKDDLELARAEEARRVTEATQPATTSTPAAKVTSVQEARAARR